MPTYAYECGSCNSTFEVEQRIVDDPLKDCPQCDKRGVLKRLIQPIAVMFKGDGFHINDYASKPEPATTGDACTGEPSSCGRCSTSESAD
jgi:putative FmdB family regulatory protein